MTGDWCAPWATPRTVGVDPACVRSLSPADYAAGRLRRWDGCFAASSVSETSFSRPTASCWRWPEQRSLSAAVWASSATRKRRARVSPSGVSCTTVTRPSSSSPCRLTRPRAAARSSSRLTLERSHRSVRARSPIAAGRKARPVLRFESGELPPLRPRRVLSSLRTTDGGVEVDS